MRASAEHQLTLEDVEKEPKSTTHEHVDGMLRPESIMKVAHEHGVIVPGPKEGQPLEAQTVEALIASGYPNPGPFGAGEDSQEFDRFLDMFGQSLAVMQTPETAQASTMEVIRDLASENIIYAELRFAPPYHLSKGHTMEEIIQGVLKGMEEGKAETGVVTKLIISIPREISSEEGVKVAEAAMAFENQGVVALDLACNEADNPPEKFVKAFQATFESNLKRTVHAGEAAKDRSQLTKNIWTAIKDLRADGLGHALPLGENSDLMSAVIDKGIRVERLPISNKCMQVGDGNFDHLDGLVWYGIPVTVGADDPGIFGPTCSLSRNLLEVANTYGVGIGGVRALTQNAINTAFLTDEEREAIQRTFEFNKQRP
jgi:adenosine deaminase